MSSVSERRTVAPRPAAPSSSAGERIVALDAHRGLAIVVFILVNTAGIRAAMPYHLGHPTWHGLTFADTFFPVFLFAMGAAMEFSTRTQRVPSVARRVALLVVLGVGLSWLRTGGPQAAGVLQKIAVAYLVAWLVLRLPRRLHLPAAIAMLAAIWVAFASFGGPGGSWEQGTNVAAVLDRLVLGHPATEGFATAIFAAVNVVGGSLVIRSIRGLAARDALVRIVLWAAASLGLGLAVSIAIPVNKRMWTPSFIVLTHGIACLYLAAFWWIAEVRKRRWIVRPFVALGRNPIFIFVLFTAAHQLLGPIRSPVTGVLADALGPTAASLMWSGALTILGVVLAEWMDRRRVYVRV